MDRDDGRGASAKGGNTAPSTDAAWVANYWAQTFERYAPGLVICDGCGRYARILSGGLGGALCPTCANAFTEANWPSPPNVSHGGRLEKWHG